MQVDTTSNPPEEQEPEKPLKTWNMFKDPDVKRFVLIRDIEINLIVCRICNKYNPGNTTKKYGLDEMRDPFWSYNFTQHVKKYHSQRQCC